MYFKKRNNTSLNKDIATIREYLSRVGDLSATNEEIEDKYAEFSESRYAAGWMRLDDELLDEFATWLDHNLNES